MAKQEASGDIKTLLKQAGLFLLGGIVGGVLTFAGQWVWFRFENSQRELTYEVKARDAIIQTPDLGEQKIQVTVGEKVIQNLSTVSVSVFNFADRDLGVVPIYVTFESVDGKPPTLIRTQPLTPSEKITRLPPRPDVSPVELQFGWSIDNANRSDTPILSVDFLFEGEKAPPVRVNANADGVSLEARDGQRDPSKTWQPYLVALSLVICFIAYKISNPVINEISESVLRVTRAAFAKWEAKLWAMSPIPLGLPPLEEKAETLAGQDDLTAYGIFRESLRDDYRNLFDRLTPADQVALLMAWSRGEDAGPGMGRAQPNHMVRERVEMKDGSLRFIAK